MASIDTQQLPMDNTTDDPRVVAPLILNQSFTSVTDAAARLAFRAPGLWFYPLMLVSLGLLSIYLLSIAYLLTTGVGVWGNNQPAAWGFPIINFVFWVGIGHAGTLISAILFLFRQNWRTSINRFAEAMTIFAVICAAVYPGLHVGRPWFAYWLFPIPNQMAMWPQFRSPLEWDVFAVGTYATVSMLFWLTGMVPDFATLRDRAALESKKYSQFFYSILALGWRGSSRHWHRFERAYLLLAALATPLVLSVHSIVSFDFATSQLPGWHTTFFPPYFVAGAIYGGFAMVLLLAVPARYLFDIKEIMTERHMELCAKVMLGVGFIATYAYTLEFFVAWYSGHHYEQSAFAFRAFGPYAWSFWALYVCNCIIPQVLWFKWARRSNFWLLLTAMSVTIGMWLERYVIVVTSLTQEFLPSSWDSFTPTGTDIAMFAGSFGLFMTLFLLFCKFWPLFAIAEVKWTMPQAHYHGDPTSPSKFTKAKTQEASA